MDPNSVQAFGHFNAQADLSRVVNNVAPLATTWHGVQPGIAAQYSAPGAHTDINGAVLPSFWGHIESVASEAGHMAAGAGGFVGHTLLNAAEAPYKFGEGLAKTVSDYQTGQSLHAQSDHLNQQMDSLMNQFKSGQITSKQYSQSLKELTQSSTNLQHDLMNFQSQTSINEKNTVTAAINTAADVATIYTLGSTVAKLTAQQEIALTQLSSAQTLVQGAAAIQKLTASEEAWNTVSPFGQQALKLATTQVLGAASKQTTAQQISKAVAVNVLFKYPLTYNALSSTGQQLYTELDNNKYGDAVKTAAFNAALLLSGGAIGWGLKYAGKAAKSVSIAAGLQPGSILDELSSRIGNGDRRALAQIAQKLVDSGHPEDVKSMIVALETNMKRANGVPATAINYIQDHLENYVSWGSLKNMTHQQVWDNMVAYFKHAEGLQKLKAAGQIDGIAASDTRAIVPGRWTIEDKNRIALADSWEAWKQANPNTAAANNPNLDRQIGEIFKNSKTAEERAKAIKAIPAQFGLEGVPKAYADQMVKDGYVAIIPKNHNLDAVPFEQTSGKLATTGAEGDFFVKAGQTVPVLRSVGSFLTWAGLSPTVAEQRVGDVFQSNLVSQLAERGYKGLAGDTQEQASSDVLSKLSNYMKAPSEGKVNLNGSPLRAPMTDYRQLTTKDVMAALHVDKATAKNVQSAILQSYLEVPRQISGLGTRILDYNFKFNPVAGAYSRLQGALRFSWNPIFEQGKLPIKAEILSQLQTGGKFPTVAGTNTFMKLFFPGQYKEIDSIAKDANFRKLMPGGLGGEAADITGATASGTGHYNLNTLRPVAGVIRSMADRMGIDTKTLLEQYPEKVTDAATAILHYDRKADFLNSPMARTLNVAFFPFRFNVKVTTFMVKALAKQDPAVQYAIIKGTMDAHKFLNSPQGQAWYSQNADAITLFKYFSPLETLSVISNALGMKHDSTAQYGELGGLPFGWIPLMLDSVGLTHFGQAYVNPKTGVIAKDYVPTNMYGAANAAIQDLLSSLYTYPGAEVGLPSKGSIDRRVVGGILPGSSKDFKAQNPTNVTPQEQQFSQSVQSVNPQQPSSGYRAAPHIPGTDVPQGYSPINVTNPNKRTGPGTPRTSSGPKKKKADFTPQLLPGQSTLGQL